MKQPAIYIMASRRNGTLYTGVTSDLIKRVWQHREGLGDGFTKRYGCKRREKQLKGGSRMKKLPLIEVMNPGWDDLFNQIV